MLICNRIMTFQTYVLEVHHGGHFVRELVLQYVGGTIDKFEEVDPDLMSIFELREGLRKLNVTDELPLYYRIGGTDLEVGLILVNSDQTVLQMFEMNRNYNSIELYVGELPQLVNDVAQLYVADNFEFEGQPNDNPIEENVVNEGADSDILDASNGRGDDDNGPFDSECDSDFEFFLDGDALNDACDPIAEPIDDVGRIEFKQPDYVKYIELITEDYNAYVESKGKGKVIDNENLSDDEVLKATYDSSEEEQIEQEFQEFNIEKDMEDPKLYVGQLFTNIYDFRAAVRMFSIKNGFEVKFTKNDKNRATAICNRIVDGGCMLVDLGVAPLHYNLSLLKVSHMNVHGPTTTKVQMQDGYQKSF